MRAGHGKNRTPAHIADNYENTLPRLNGGVVQGYFKYMDVRVHFTVMQHIYGFGSAAP